MKRDEIKVPALTLGTYRSQSGKRVTFTSKKLRDVTKNTNRMIDDGVLTPPVAYGGHPAFSLRKGEAHGSIAGLVLENNVVSFRVRNPSKQLREGVRSGKILARSPEIVDDFTHPDDEGKDVEVGIVAVGLAMLGAERPAIKHPKIVPLSKLAFGEGVSEEDADAARSELERGGFVSATFDGDVLVFSEIDVDPESFGEDHAVDDVVVITANRNGWRGRKGKVVAIREGVFYAVDSGDEYPGVMRWLASDEVVGDDGTTNLSEDEMNEELRKALEEQDAKWQKRFDQQKADFDKTVAQFSESSAHRTKVLAFREDLTGEKKHLPKLLLDRIEAYLLKPKVANDPELYSEATAIFEAIPSAIAPGGTAGKRTKKAGESEEEGGDADEPKAVAKLKPRHFSDLSDSANSTAIDAAVKETQAFSEYLPEDLRTKFDKASSDVIAQARVLESYVKQRDIGESAN